MSSSNGHIENSDKVNLGIEGCPFCGHRNVLTIRDAANEHFHVCCGYCGAQGPQVRDSSDVLIPDKDKPKEPLVHWSKWSSIPDAIEVWNKRKPVKVGRGGRFERNSSHVAACPFCGHANVLSISYLRPVHRAELHVQCNYCGAQGPTSQDPKPKERDGSDNFWDSSWNSIENTLRVWNSRVPTKPVTPTVSEEAEQN